MNLKHYIKDKILFIILFFVLLIISFLFFIYFKIDLIYIIYFYALFIIFNSFVFISDYLKRKKFYNSFLNIINSSKEPYNAIKEINYPKFFDGNATIDTVKYCCNSMYTDYNICDKQPLNLRELTMSALKDRYSELIKNKISTAIKNLETEITEDKVLLYFYISTTINYIILNYKEKTFIKFYSDKKENIILFNIETNADISENNDYILFLQKLAKSMRNQFEIKYDQTLKITIYLK